jgi:hypothetical protein
VTPPFSHSPFSSRRGRRWHRLPPAWALVIVTTIVLALSLWGQGASTVFAEPADGVRIGTAAYTHTCIDRDELAGVTQAEAGAQSVETQIKIMQIFVAEADSRGLTFCALSRLTRFSGVRYYVRQHPGSYLAYQVDHPREDMLEMAGAVLRGDYPDVRAGAMHFDGSSDGLHIIFRP